MNRILQNTIFLHQRTGARIALQYALWVLTRKLLTFKLRHGRAVGDALAVLGLTSFYVAMLVAALYFTTR